MTVKAAVVSLRYEWGDSLRVGTKAGVSLNKKVAASVAGHELEKIKSKNKGVILPQQVVDAARNRNSPLHDVFEWDDKAAGERYRCDQARLLTRSLVILVVTKKTESEPSRAFVQVRPSREGGGYKPIQVAMQNKDEREFVIDQAHQQLVGWRKRWAALKEYAECHPILDHVDQAIDSMASARKRRKK